MSRLLKLYKYSDLYNLCSVSLTCSQNETTPAKRSNSRHASAFSSCRDPWLSAAVARRRFNRSRLTGTRSGGAHCAPIEKRETFWYCDKLYVEHGLIFSKVCHHALPTAVLVFPFGYVQLVITYFNWISYGITVSVLKAKAKQYKWHIEALFGKLRL